MQKFIDKYDTIKYPLSDQNLYDTYLLINDLQNYTLTFKRAEACVVCFRESESIFFNNYFRYMEDYYNSYYSEVFDNYEKFRDYIFSPKKTVYSLMVENSNIGEELNAYQVLKSAKQGIYGVIKIKINTSDLFYQMDNILLNVNKNTDKNGLVAITDKQGQVLLHVGEDALLNNLQTEGYAEFIVDQVEYVSVSITDTNAISFTYVIPKSFFIYELKQLTWLFIFIFFIFVATISLVGVFLMQRHAKSLQHILFLIGATEKKSSLFSKIDIKIQALIEDNALLSNNLKQEQEQLFHMFYEKLLNGSYINSKDVALNMQAIGLNISGSVFCVCNLCTDIYDADSEIDAITAKNLSIKYAANDISISDLYSHIIVANQVVTVIFVANTNQDIFKKNINLFFQKFKRSMQEYNFSYYICVGEVVNNMMQIRKSYNQAQLLRLRFAKQNNTDDIYYISAQEVDNCKDTEITDSLKNKIYMLVYKGETDEIRLLLNDIMSEIIKNAKSKTTVTMYIYTIWELFIKILDTTNIISKEEYHEMYAYLDRYTDFKKIEIVSKGFFEVSEYFRITNATKETILMSEIKELINVEFTNPQLSLTYLADRFGISVTKLCKLFKDHNIEYLNYITQLRMNKTKYYLTNTNETIKNIAKQTGYTSLNSFCRAFKRLQGISPNEYRIKTKE